MTRVHPEFQSQVLEEALDSAIQGCAKCVVRLISASIKKSRSRDYQYVVAFRAMKEAAKSGLEMPNLLPGSIESFPRIPDVVIRWNMLDDVFPEAARSDRCMTIREITIYCSIHLPRHAIQFNTAIVESARSESHDAMWLLLSLIGDKDRRVNLAAAIRAVAGQAHTKILQRLIREVSRFKSCWRTIASELNIASLNGHLASVYMLLNHGASVEYSDDGFHSALEARLVGSYEAKGLLLRNYRRDREHPPLLHHLGFRKLAKSLSNRIADDRDVEKWCLGSENERNEIVKLLLMRGARVRKTFCSNPLQLGYQYASATAVRDVLEHGANIADGTDKGYTLMQLAVKRKEPASFIKELLVRGEDPQRMVKKAKDR